MAITLDGTNGVSLAAPLSVPLGALQAGAVTPAMTQVGALPSMVRLHTANGYGSTNTVIRRFTNVVTNQGSDITYADSATLGALLTINTNGVYAISYTDNDTISVYCGASLNSTQLTTAFDAITVSDRLCLGYGTGNSAPGSSSVQVYLTAGSLIRPHAKGVAAGVAANCLFTITRVA